LRQAIVEAKFAIEYQPPSTIGAARFPAASLALASPDSRHGPPRIHPGRGGYGLISQLGEWVWRSPPRAASWPDHIKLAVNVSPVQVQEPHLALHVASALAVIALCGQQLELEITEAVLSSRRRGGPLAIWASASRVGCDSHWTMFGTG